MTTVVRDWAEPGDPDLDIDIDGVGVIGVVVLGREVLVHIAGGLGRFKSTETGRMEDIDEVVDSELRMQIREGSETDFEALKTVLFDWQDRRVPLRIVGAPGKMFTIIEDRNRWLPFPRNPHPDWL